MLARQAKSKGDYAVGLGGPSKSTQFKLGQAMPDFVSLRERVEALGNMPTPELRKFWRQFLGAPPP